MRLSLVVAAAQNDVIGVAGGLPWHLPEDLKLFREITTGHPIVMGRRTHASIGRALPNRLNLVVTHHPELVAADCRPVASLDEAIEVARATNANELFVIGGASLYAAALPRADRVHLTRVHADVEGDTRWPGVGDEWTVVSKRDYPEDARHRHSFSYLVLERAAPADMRGNAGR